MLRRSAIFVLLVAAALAAQAPAPTAFDLDAFFSGFLHAQLRRDHIAGAVVAVVENGQLVFEQGYGFADMQSRRAVSATDTLFRPGSISKLFTWTAVMQQVQAGKINLDADVNQYLDFRIPATFAGPITVRDLMMHRPGFEEANRDLILPLGGPIPSLAALLRTHLPERIFPAGTTPAYSNYGAALAGYIVQRVSGEPFDEYIERHIFRPLDMVRSSFRQPLPPALAPLAASGYLNANGKAQPYEVVGLAPAGALATTADDIAHFMIAHLGDGTYHGAPILSPATLAEMHAPQPALVPGVNSMCLGFYQENRNGLAIIGHGGDTIYFHSDLHLIPSAHLGFFVSYNSPAGAVDRSALWRQFLDRYFPYAPSSPAALPTAAADSRSVAGTYLTSRRSQGNLLAAGDMLAEPTVVANPDHTISLSSDPGTKFAEVAPLLFQKEHGQARIGFRKDAAGDWLMVPAPIVVFQRVGLLASVGFDRPLMLGSLGILLLTLLLWILAPWIRRHYRRTLALTRADRRQRFLVRTACLCDLVCVFGLLALFGQANNDIAVLDRTGEIHVLQTLGLLGVLGTLVAIYYAVGLWRRRPVAAAVAVAAGGGVSAGFDPLPRSPNGGLGRLAWSGTALGLCAFAWFALYWGLLNFRLHY